MASFKTEIPMIQPTSSMLLAAQDALAHVFAAGCDLDRCIAEAMLLDGDPRLS
jgi:hypothetical protein